MLSFWVFSYINLKSVACISIQPSFSVIWLEFLWFMCFSPIHIYTHISPFPKKHHKVRRKASIHASRYLLTISRSWRLSAYFHRNWVRCRLYLWTGCQLIPGSYRDSQDKQQCKHTELQGNLERRMHLIVMF